MRAALDGARTTLCVIDLYGFVHRQHKDLAVADGALRTRAGRLQQAVDRSIDEVVVDGDFELDLAEQVGLILRAAVRLGLAPLSSEPHRVAHAHARHAQPVQCLLNRLQLRRLDHGENQFHGESSATGIVRPQHSVLRAECHRLRRLTRGTFAEVRQQRTIGTMPSRSRTSRPLEYLRPWLEDVSQVQMKSLDATGGLSGAQIWRISTPTGELCLRRWPPEHPSLEGLQAIHGLLKHVASTGFVLVPVPLKTSCGTTYSDQQDHLWELTPWMPGGANLSSQPTSNRLSAAMLALAQFHRAAQTYRFAEDAARSAPSPGLQQRLAMLQSLQQGGLRQLRQATQSAPASDLRELAAEMLEGVDRSLNSVVSTLRQIVDVPLPLQWCLRDVRQDHLLFTGNEVTGLVDFGAVAVDSVAGDVARLLGSLVLEHPHSWQAGLDAYDRHRPLSSAERQAIVCFDQGGLLCSAANWCRWLFVESRSFPQTDAVQNQLRWIRDRLNILAALSRC